MLHFFRWFWSKVRARRAADAGVLLFAFAWAAEAVPPVFTERPVTTWSSVGEQVVLSAAADNVAAWQWRKDGRDLPGQAQSRLILNHFQVADVGIYTVAASNVDGTVVSPPAIVNVQSFQKISGTAVEVGSDILHPNGNVFDQILLTGAAATVRADWGQITRVSFVDLDDDIVQVEFSGSGALTLVMEQASGPAVAVNYHQPTVAYMKGHVSLYMDDADESTQLSVFSVGTMTAVNQALFRPEVNYDGVADIGLIAVTTQNGSIGAIRVANAALFRTAGLTGIFAPEAAVREVFVGEILAADAATPVLVFRNAVDVRITGGDTWQANGAAIEVDGISGILHTDGTTSHGGRLPAQPSLARLQRRGVDVTAALLDAEPVPVYRAAPQYPFSMRVAGITGEALIEFVVDTTGRVRNAFAVSVTRNEFAVASIQAINQWLFIPGRRSGVPVNVRLQQPIYYSLNG